MKFNVPETGAPLDTSILQIGNVYRCKGGSKTKYWIVVGMDEKTVFLLGINGDGVMTSATAYGRHVFDGSSNLFRGREVLGYCAGLENLEFDIQWSEE